MKNENNIDNVPTEKVFWKSLDEKYQTPEYQQTAHR